MCTAIKELIADGREAGRIEGLSEGRNVGRTEGRTEGIIGAISICRNLNLSDEVIAQNIQETYDLSEDEARKFLFRH